MLAKLSTTPGADSLEQRKEKIALLIKLHVQHIQHIVIMKRRRSQQRAQRRLRMLRTFFMQQMMQLQTQYVQMFTLLRKKHLALRAAAPTPMRMEFLEEAMQNYDDDMFLNTFHVTRPTFKWLCTKLTPSLSKVGELKKSQFPISPQKCIALALYFLASGEPLSMISERCGLINRRIIKCIKIFCTVLVRGLGRYLQLLPQTVEDCDNVVAGFQRESNMPPALVGILGVCIVEKRQTPGTLLRMEYLLDDRMNFRELQLSSGSRMPPSPMYSQPPNALTRLPRRCINEHMVSPFVLAPLNQKFPLRPWLLQRYQNPSAPYEYHFNEVAEHLHELSDCALHRLASRWRFLSEPLDICFGTAFTVITGACVLHNMLEEMGEPHMLEWGNTVDVTRMKPMPFIPQTDTSEEAEQARDVRDFLARTIRSTPTEI
ncbi:uncharacterized protein LOC115632079 [Scaptodrosophila lebanonensis]|uniref:Uncharacterized protein LOC115632079 n=1 Tax=Drosophila lebanonensis TaxID=7225 RepID=A0A6J2UA68_DROLE|nr:uncharacterized protein LOC115632079 [Scaptodrosophila lebanonensis]